MMWWLQQKFDIYLIGLISEVVIENLDGLAWLEGVRVLGSEEQAGLGEKGQEALVHGVSGFLGDYNRLNIFMVIIANIKIVKKYDE